MHPKDTTLDPELEEACDSVQCHIDDMGYLIDDMELYRFAEKHDGNPEAMIANIDELIY